MVQVIQSMIDIPQMAPFAALQMLDFVSFKLMHHFLCTRKSEFGRLWSTCHMRADS